VLADLVSGREPGVPVPDGQGAVLPEAA
jgi:hypothetical protein